MGNSQDSEAEAVTRHPSSPHRNLPIPQESSPNYRASQTMQTLSKFPCISLGVKQLSMIFEADEHSSVTDAMHPEHSSDSNGTDDTDQRRAGVEIPVRPIRQETDAMTVEKRGALTPTELKFYLREFRATGK